MEIFEFQSKLVSVLARYGRPPSVPAHLRKLGEELGELSEVASNVLLEDDERDILIIREAVDMINVLTSLIDLVGGNLEVEAVMKMEELEKRMGRGRFDRRYGRKDVEEEHAK